MPGGQRWGLDTMPGGAKQWKRWSCPDAMMKRAGGGRGMGRGDRSKWAMMVFCMFMTTMLFMRI